MQTLINILVFLLILTGIIVIHELGHLIAAKFFKVYCGAFSIGMGPKIFGKKDGIIIWEKLEQKIQHSEDVKNRYKSFDGLFAYKIKNIKNNELFININISAKNCIEIIANIMNEFDINEDFVKISIN